MPKFKDVPFRTRFKVLGEVTMELIRKNLGMFLLITGFFTLGYATKNWEDAQERRAAASHLDGILHEMSVACDLRIANEVKHSQDQMADRDKLLADQTARLQEQTLLIQTIAQRQAENTQFTKNELSHIRASSSAAQVNSAAAAKGANEAAKGANEAKDAANKVAKNVVTDKDRQQINKAVDNNKAVEKKK